MWEFTTRPNQYLLPLENPTVCTDHKVELAHIGDSHTGQGSTRLETGVRLTAINQLCCMGNDAGPLPLADNRTTRSTIYMG
jgi:hypothetical protein